MNKGDSSIKLNALIVASNVILLAAYYIYFRLRYESDFIYSLAIAIALQICICFVLAAVFEKGRKAFVLSAGLILLVGFSTCYYVI